MKEVKSQRKDMERHFVQVDKRINLLEKQFDNVTHGFKLLEQVIDKLTQSIEQVDMRFKQVELHFEQSDRRMDLLHEEMRQHSEQIVRRFDKIEQPLQKVDQRFVKILQHFDSLLETEREMMQFIVKMRENQDRLFKEIAGQEKWIKVVTGNVETEKGRTLEQLFAEALSYGLKNPDIKPESIRLNQKIEDLDGLLFKKPRYGEVDLIAQNGKLIVLEIKATAKPDDVNTLSWKVELLQLQNPDKQVQGLFIAMGASEKVRQRCLEYEIELVD
ncbi:MAG TPA: hypothetical protein DCM38_03625 [Gammaproteobacteria bacterium]|nr:hypothetical protein [Gammaproteobacteria bacterium]